MPPQAMRRHPYFSLVPKQSVPWHVLFRIDIASPRLRKSLTKKPAGHSLMVRLDDESKVYLVQTAKLRGISIRDYLRVVAVPQVRRDFVAARKQNLAMTLHSNSKFWNALATPLIYTRSQKRLGGFMQSKERV